MKKRIISVVLAFSLLLMLSLATAADTNIVNSMDFQGNAQELSLEDAINTMMTDNPTVKQADFDLEQASLDYDKIIKARKEEKEALKSNQLYGGNMKYQENLQLKDLSADYTKANAQRAYDATIEGLKADLEKSYYELLQADQLVQINNENLQVASDLYEKTKKKFELGMVAKQEVLNGELNQVNAQKDYNAAANNLKAAKMQFNIKLGFDVMKEVKLKGSLTYSEYKLGSIAEAVQKALDQRREIKSAQYNADAENLNMIIATKQYPEGSTKYREQNLKLLKAQKDLSDSSRNIEMEVRNNYMQVGQKFEEIKAGEKSVELAAEGLKISQATYDAGMALLTDVQKAQVTLQQAKLGLSKAILNYNLEVLKYEDSISVGRK